MERLTNKSVSKYFTINKKKSQALNKKRIEKNKGLTLSDKPLTTQIKLSSYLCPDLNYK